MSWQEAADFATSEGGRLATLAEARSIIADHAGKASYVPTDYSPTSPLGSFFPGINTWAAVGDLSTKAFVQIGNYMSNYPGTTHFEVHG